MWRFLGMSITNAISSAVDNHRFYKRSAVKVE